MNSFDGSPFPKSLLMQASKEMQPNREYAKYKTGIRTPVKIKLGFKNFDLYSAVNPKTGEEFTLLLQMLIKNGCKYL